MKKSADKILWCIASAALALALVMDGLLSFHGLGTVIGCVVMIVALTVTAFTSPRSAARQFVQPVRNSSVASQPIFAHVPGPGEPGYDPTYDPDDDKYWRRYYG